MPRITGKSAGAAISQAQPFTTSGSLRGTVAQPAPDAYIPYTGFLPDEWREDIRKDASHVDYIVWSYATPIAWRLTNGQWILPDVRYSVTTSKHQGIVRRSLGITPRTETRLALTPA